MLSAFISRLFCSNPLETLGSFVLLWMRVKPLNAKTSKADGTLAPVRAHRDAIPPKPITKSECPYQYILDVYGRYHFQNIVQVLDADLEKRDGTSFELILELMDAIHFGAILVDDVADGSLIRKGQPAAHVIFGEAETINRAYLRIFEVIEKVRQEKPHLLPFVLDNLTQIHKGQDDSLVWRRDGFQPGLTLNAALSRYRECASLKTGALFRLVGQLVSCGHELDQLMSDFGWYCQLQNDCKNVFSIDVIKSKGALAEDLSNGEYSFPILVAMYTDGPIREKVLVAMRQDPGQPKATQDEIQAAALMLQEPEVRTRCLAELNELWECNKLFASLWGRREAMSLEKVKSALSAAG